MFLKRSLCLLSYSIAFAGPEYASTIAGDVSLSHAPQLLEVTASDRSIIEWNRFSIPAEETVRFIQPSSSATVLNRVIGQDLSELFGRLEANGAVYLINPRGFLVGKTGVIDTAAFLASTLDCSNQAFLEGAELSLQGDSEAPLTHFGTIRAKGGDVVLVAHQVDQGGLITAPEGSVSLSASHEILLKPKAFPLLNIRPDRRAFGIGMRGSIEALHASLQSDSLSLHALEYYEGTITLTQEGGKILLSTEGGPIHIQQTAHAKAPAGEIAIRIAPQEGDHKPLYQLGTLDVSGAHGGSIQIETPKMLHTGHLHANGEGHGGRISVFTLESLIETRIAKSTANGNLNGGTVALEGGRLFTSGTLEAQGGNGGSIHVLGPNISLFGAKIHAIGHQESGGHIFIGHQAGEGKLQTEKVVISPSTQLHTTGSSEHGRVLISAKSTERLAPRVGAAVEYPQWPLVDPNAGYGSGFASEMLVLSTGNIVITKPSDSFVATSAGAVYLYDGSTGDLISMLTGSAASDSVGSQTPVAFGGNGNYLIRSPGWANGAATSAGAATWGSGTTGIWGTVSSANSLVGTSTGDQVSTTSSGTSSIITLSNGNYVVTSGLWDNGPVANVGALTWGNGTTGITGTVSIINSLIGSTADDQIGFFNPFVQGRSVALIGNGNYVVMSPYWDRVDGGALAQVGAATWGNGTTGITGTVSVTNSIIGSSVNDKVGSNGVNLFLTNGNFVLVAGTWDRIDGGVVSNVGACVWMNGATGITGTISVTNALIGSSASDQVGSLTVSTPCGALTNGNYVVTSIGWDRVVGGVLAGVGAYTWGNGTTGITGTVSVTNSLIGSSAGDGGSAIVISLANGNYVVCAPVWSRIDGGVVASVGAAVWGNGTTGITGTISVTNGLIGSTASDIVGYWRCPLTNGNYVVGSKYWDRVVGGAVVNAGAAVWADGTTGITGTVSITNALIGFTANDRVGSTFSALYNGNYVVASPIWDRVDGGTVADVGAVTWGSGTTGITGTVSIINSLIGSTASDSIGTPVPVALTNGNYVVRGTGWDRVDGGAVAGVGAVTWGNGVSGTTGTVSATNSLIGSSANDNVGLTLFTLSNGNYVVGSSPWDRVDGGAVNGVGAVTWCSGSGGLMTGTVSVNNSLIGSTTQDSVGNGGIITLPSGNYLISSPEWNRIGTVALTDCGAVTWGSGGGRIAGTVSQINSVIGTSASSSLQRPIAHPTVWNAFICQFTGAASVIIGGLPSVSLEAIVPWLQETAKTAENE